MVERRRPTISTGMGMGGTWHDAAVSTTAEALGVRVKLKRPLERSIRAGHPWIYREALDLRDNSARPGALRTGSVVDVIGADGKFVARGLYDGASPLAVRIATLDPKTVSDAVRARAMRIVGNYAVNVDWSDGHSTGIYNFRSLRENCPCDACKQLRAEGKTPA